MSSTGHARTNHVLSKVPEVTLLFWVVKVLTTGMGEAASDFLANSIGPAIAVPGALVALVLALRRQLRQDRYVPHVYWTAVAMVAVFGTMAADGVHLVGVPYAVSTPVCALALALVLRAWKRSEGTLSVHTITTRRRERFYWAAVFATFALGTAAGDLTAVALGWGFFPSALVFAAAIALPALASRRPGLDRVAIFWTAYVLTRPLGASVADWLGKRNTGLGLGDGTVTLWATVAIVLLVGALGLARRTAPATTASTPATGTITT